MSNMTKEELLGCCGCIHIKKYPKKCGACSTWLGREVHRLENVIQGYTEKALELYNFSYYETLNEGQVMHFLRLLIIESFLEPEEVKDE